MSVRRWNKMGKSYVPRKNENQMENINEVIREELIENGWKNTLKPSGKLFGREVLEQEEDPTIANEKKKS